jgi:type IV secretory pathway VirJ component
MKHGLLLSIFFLFACQSPARQLTVQQTPLPLVVTPAKPTDDRMLFYVSGDGGWTQFCRQLSAAYVGKGIPVVGLNAFK